MKKNLIGFLILFAVAFAASFTTGCKKDPFRGWTYYTEAPPPPKITAMSAVIKNCEPPYPVTFYQVTANQLGNMIYFWDFGDGNVSSEKNPTHIYPVPGDFTITLIVYNEVGADTAYLHVPELALSSIPVEAGFTYTHFNNNNFAPNKVLFANTSSGANIFAWDFGDGGQSNNDAPAHVFQNPGLYTVKLRGTCTDGSFDETTQQIFINPAPQRVFIDSINLMLPSSHKGQKIFIDLYHNTTFVGTTITKTPSSYPVKFRAPQDFYSNGYFFDFVTFGGNEVFRFVISREMGDDPPLFLYEISLSSYFIQSNFYPRAYFQIEHVPVLPDVFIDLYMSY